MFGKILRFLVLSTFVFSCVSAWVGIYLFLHGAFFKNPEEMDKSVFLFVPVIAVILLGGIFLGGKE